MCYNTLSGLKKQAGVKNSPRHNKRRDLKGDEENDGGSQTLDDLIGKVRDLELEVSGNVLCGTFPMSRPTNTTPSIMYQTSSS